MKDDIISRAAAIDAFLTELTKRERTSLLHTWSTVEVKYFIAKILEQMPSAQPERKRGRWKPCDLTFGRNFYACSVCGEAADVATTMGELIYKFCPHCGARMDGEKDG